MLYHIEISLNSSPTIHFHFFFYFMISEFVLVEKSITVLVPATPGGGRRGVATAPPAITVPAWETQLSKDLKICPIMGRLLPHLIKDTPIFVPLVLHASAGYPKAAVQIEAAVQAGGMCGRVGVGHAGPPGGPRPTDGNHQTFPGTCQRPPPGMAPTETKHRQPCGAALGGVGGVGERIRVERHRWYQKI